tara:strand:- start:95026 stop:95601 length:576 start_codon:yes stop_codon:yes gene_type:complete
MITTTINLLPWREKRRKQQQQDFMIMLAAAAGIGVLIWWMWTSSVASDVDGQTGRNNYVKGQLAQLDEQIVEIKKLEERRAELVSRMETIQRLQNDRPSIVYIFDQLVRAIPDGVFYTSIIRQGPSFTITGQAVSNTRISSLMRNLNESPWFVSPALETVTAVADSEASNFVLRVSQEAQDSKVEPKGGVK